MTALSYLDNLTRKQGLNTLLHIYEVYKDIIHHYLSEPTSPSNKDLNIIYMRELVPVTQKLVRELHLDPTTKGKGFKLPKNYILSTNLFGLEKALQNLGKDSEYARIEIADIYGQIKELVEKELAVSQSPIPEIDNLIDKTKCLISTSLFTHEKKNPLSDTIQIGPIKHIEHSIYCNDEKLKLTKQLVELCKLFMEKADSYISDDVIKDTISRKRHLSTVSMEKLVSKLRTALKSKRLNVPIERLNSEGYKFITKYIR